MSEINSFGDSQKCYLWIEELLQFDDLRNGPVCISQVETYGTSMVVFRCNPGR